MKLRGEELVGLHASAQLRPKRRHLQMVFQDPHASLNPGMTLETALAHPLKIHKLTKGDAETEAKVRETLELVGLAPVERFAVELAEPTCRAARSSAPRSPARSSSAPTCWSPTSPSRCST